MNEIRWLTLLLCSSYPVPSTSVTIYCSSFYRIIYWIYQPSELCVYCFRSRFFCYISQSFELDPLVPVQKEANMCILVCESCYWNNIILLYIPVIPSNTWLTSTVYGICFLIVSGAAYCQFMHMLFPGKDCNIIWQQFLFIFLVIFSAIQHTVLGFLQCGLYWNVRLWRNIFTPCPTTLLVLIVSNCWPIHK